MLLSSQRNVAVPLPAISRSIVFSKMAPRMRSPVKAGLVMMRVRISCTLANISSSRYSDSWTP